MTEGWRNRIFTFKVKYLSPNLWKLHHELEGHLGSSNLQERNFKERIRVVRHAFTHSRFYSDHYSGLTFDPAQIKTESEFQTLPVLTRENLRNRFDDIKAENTRGWNVRNLRTSGTTGPSLAVLQDKRSPLAPIQWRLLKWWGINPSANKAFIYRYPRPWFKKILNTILWWPTQRTFLAGIEMDEKHVRNFIKRYQRIRPDLLQGYVDLVYEFALFLLEQEVEITPPKAVWVTAGPLLEYQRNLMEKAFKAPVYDQYGCTEIMMVSAECKKRQGLHIMTDMVFVECLDDHNKPVANGEWGKLVITDLTNYAFPLIRYEIGDYGRLLISGCSCGKQLPLMDKVRGRQTAIITTPSGVPLDPTFLTTLFDPYADLVRGFQYVKKSTDSLTLSYVPFNIDSQKMVFDEIVKKLEMASNFEFKVSVEQVESLQKVNGKIPLVIIEG